MPESKCTGNWPRIRAPEPVASVGARRFGPAAGRFDAQRDELDRRVEGEAVEGLVGRGERRFEAVLAVDPRHRNLAALAVIEQHRDLVLAPVLGGDLLGGQPVVGLGRQLAEDLARLVDVDGTGLRQGVVVADE
jgi:hypothetical protein